MPYFQFGLEREAQIYYLSALNALSADPQAPEVTDKFAESMKEMVLQIMPIETIVAQFVKWTRDNIRAEGSNDEDENGVAWYLALYVRAYEKACAPARISFEDIYKKCFIKYYQGA